MKQRGRSPRATLLAGVLLLLAAVGARWTRSRLSTGRFSQPVAQALEPPGFGELEPQVGATQEGQTEEPEAEELVVAEAEGGTAGETTAAHTGGEAARREEAAAAGGKEAAVDPKDGKAEQQATAADSRSAEQPAGGGAADEPSQEAGSKAAGGEAAAAAGAAQEAAAGGDAILAQPADASNCPVQYDRISMEEVTNGTTPYLFGAPARPTCVNCNRTDKLWSNFCQFKNSGPVCPLWARRPILASWVERGWELPLTLTPCDLWPHLAGRTLWLVGDSMMLDFYKSTHCFMFEFWPSLETRPLTDNATLREKLTSSTVPPSCAHLLGGARICYVRMDKGQDFPGRALPVLLEVGLLSPKDLLVANFGLHHGSQEYSGVLKAFVAYFAEHKAELPKLLWQQVSAQHFGGPGGEYSGGKPPFKCKNIDGYEVEGQGRLVLEPGHKDTANVLHGGWRNAMADPIMQAAGVPIIQSFNDTVPLSAAHRDNGQGHECTHYCFPSAPEVWVARLVEALRQVDSSAGSSSTER